MNRSHFARLRSVAVAAGLLAVAARAEAQQAPNLSLERFQPTPGNGRILAVPTSQTMGLWSYTVDVALDYAKAPLGSVKGADLLSHQLTGQLLAGIGFGRLDVGLALPATLYQATDPKATMLLLAGGKAKPALGDLRLNAKVRLTPAEWIGGVAIEALASFPTGDGAAFSGEGGFGLGGRVVGDVRFSRVQIAGYFGYRYRTTPGQFWSLYVRDELLAGLGVSVGIVPRRLWVFGNTYGSFGFHSSDVKDPMTNMTTTYPADAGTRPLEALLGLTLKTPVGVTLSVAAGAGFGTGSGDSVARSGYGSPQFRALGMLGFDVEELDRDSDGLPDKKDGCPTEAGPEANGGCPTKDTLAAGRIVPESEKKPAPPVVATTEGEKKPAEPEKKEPLLGTDENDENDGDAAKGGNVEKAGVTTGTKDGAGGKVAKGKGPQAEEGEGGEATDGQGGKAGAGSKTAKDKKGGKGGEGEEEAGASTEGKGQKGKAGKGAKGGKGGEGEEEADASTEGKGKKGAKAKGGKGGEGEEEADASTEGKKGKSGKGKKGGKGGEGDEEADSSTEGKGQKGKSGKGAKGGKGAGEGGDEGGEEALAARDRRGGGRDDGGGEDAVAARDRRGGGRDDGGGRRSGDLTGARLADTGGPEVLGDGALGEKVYFALNEASVEPASVPVVTRIATQLKEHPEILRVVIEGHADETGPEDYNQRLSLRRAMHVATTLMEQGVDSSRIEMRGYGSSRPLTPNPKSREERATNRRVEFRVVLQ